MRRYEENGYLVTEYDSGSVVRVLISETEEPKPQEPQPTLEDMQMQSLINTEYLVTLAEINNL